ncbi:Gfo/Idh/MocA family protein [Cohnella hashimotonis]|uniref:Gfo/Idh/MocA family oxidoreductase n=1 Tax=Cohnella hashimotonis TaxID=2826895 RepID=A0ABT6TLB2_9BACL|nr:Gfo/Idh/MocA family oxidoreductase [Cohnella hashimotonis]MDI4647504.1 Gfo/Idh/MocA family oxidoreductase [Cohnella hashimotonis]
MNKIRLALIGVGDMGTGHAMGFDQIENCEIVWVADPSESNLARAMPYIRRNNPGIVASYLELLEHIDTFDAVVISLPNYMHRDAAVPFIERGKHVFLEKPVAPTLGECDEIIAKAEAAGVILQIGLTYRYSNIYRRMRRELDAGRLGDVTMMWCKEFRDPFPPVDWFYDASKSGGALIEKDCHHFDIFNWMIDSKPRRVFASGGQHVLKDGQPNVITNSYTHYETRTLTSTSIVDHAWVIVEYENGSKANLGLCMYLKPRNLMDEGLEIGLLGSNGGQMIAKKDKTIDIFGPEDKSRDHIDLDHESDSVNGGHTGSQRQRHAFLNSVATGEAPYANGRIGRDALLVALAAERSIKEERYVYISELS